MQKAEGLRTRRPSGLCGALGPTMASSPWVAVHLGFLPGTRVLSLQSKAQPQKDWGSGSDCQPQPSATSTPALLLPSLAR